MLTAEEFRPRRCRPFDPETRWVWIEVPVHGAAVETLARLAQREGFSFNALAAQALHHFAVHGPTLLRAEAAHAKSLINLHPNSRHDPALPPGRRSRPQ